MKGSTFLVEESGDELNDETFGDLDSNVIAKPDFEFGRSPLPSPPVKPSGRKALTASELERQFLAGRTQPQTFNQVPPGIPSVPSASIPIQQQRRVVMNLEDLENSFRSSASISSSFQDVTRPMSPPPGLVPQQFKPPKPPVQITFPQVGENETEDSHPSDPNRFLMSKYEREGIRHIHMAQLTTENPLLEDFYYQAFSKRSLKHQSQSNTPLYLPLPNQKKKQTVSKEKIKTFEGALGKFTSSTARKPRQQLQLPADASPQALKIDHEEVSSEELYFGVLGTIEKALTAIFRLEDASEQGDDNYVEIKRECREIIVSLYNLEDERPWTRIDTLRFVHSLGLSKGRKAIFRALRNLDMAFTNLFVKRLVENFEYLNVLRPNTSQPEIESFVNLILSPLVPFISESSSFYILDILKNLYSKNSFLWMLFTRPGLIMMCILMSRMEICKSSIDTDTDPIFSKDYPEFIVKLYESISERLNNFFAIPTLKSVSSPKHSFDGGDFYVWQFIALIALNVDGDCKKAMIVELRDKIMTVVQGGSPKDITNLNVFLNVLGLDSSQLANQ